MMNQNTDNKYLYEESLFVDIQDLLLEIKTNSISFICNKILGNLLAQNQIINFFSNKAQKKRNQLFYRYLINQFQK